ncbi:hypothetical protein [Pseudomonas sp. NPDC089406]|uniref:hypothetical protein n=1 Tax=Pseudomonas sp. NPDC089406 TaxID=3364463 RepID=UPI00384E11C5
MPNPAIVEIFGTVATPYLPVTSEGPASLLVSVKSGSGSTQHPIAYCGSQLSGSPIPFSLRLDRTTLADGVQLTLEAGCGYAWGEAAQVARVAMPLVLDDQDRLGPFDLQLEPVAGAPLHDTQKLPTEPSVLPLHLSVLIPEELVQEKTHLQASLLRIQADGNSNLDSSNIAEASLQQSGSGCALTLYVDANVLNDDDRLMLNVVLFDQQYSTPLAGRVIRNLNPGNLHEIGEITLRAPRK